MSVQQGERMVEITLALITLFDGAFPEGALVVIRRGHGLDHRQGQLAFAEIVPDILSGGCGIALVIQQIIDDLKRDAKRVPVSENA